MTTTSAAIHPDPSVFLEASIAPETAAFNEQLRAMSEGVPGLADLPPSEIRQSRAGLIERLDHAEERTVPGPAGDVAIRTLTPATVEGVHLYLHGGGWSLGSEDAQDPRLWALAQELTRRS